MSLASSRILTLDAGTFTLRTRTVAPNLARGNGQAARWGRFATALLAHVALTGETGRYGTCPLSGVTFDRWHDSDVDRLDPTRGYVAGNVMLVSARANWGRGMVQDNGSDIVGWERYAAAVRVQVPHVAPSAADAKALFNAYGSRADRNRGQSQTLTGSRMAAALEVQQYVSQTY